MESMEIYHEFSMEIPWFPLLPLTAAGDSLLLGVTGGGQGGC